MAVHVRILTLTCIVSILTCTKCKNDFDFVIQPTSLTVKEGDSANFSCNLFLRSVSVSDKIIWENGQTQRVSPTEAITITQNISQRTATSTLLFRVVNRTMDNMYRCVVQVTDPIEPLVISEFGRLEVQFFMMETALICSAPATLVFRESETVTVKCHGPICNPEVDYQWIEDTVHSIVLPARSNATEKHLQAQEIAQRSLHNKMFMCVATSNAFPGQSANCSIGPFQVLHSPVVEILPNQFELIPLIAVEVTLFCRAEGFPEVERYSWSCEPNNYLSSCSSYSSNLTLTLINTDSEVKVNVSCEAGSIAGASTNNSVIHTNRARRAVVSECKPNALFISDMKNDLRLERYQDTNTMKCYMVMTSTERVVFRWYRNGRIIREKRGEYDLINTRDGSKQLVVQDITEVTGNSIVTCEVVEPPYNRVACNFLDDSNTTIVPSPGLPTQSSTNSLPTTVPSPITTSIRTPIGTTMTTSYGLKLGFWDLFWVIAISAIIGFGLLVCAVIAILVSRRLVHCFNGRQRPAKPTQVSAGSMSRADDNDLSVDNNGDPIYELPQPSTGGVGHGPLNLSGVTFPYDVRIVQIGPDSFIRDDHDRSNYSSGFQNPMGETNCLDISRQYENQQVLDLALKNKSGAYFLTRMAEEKQVIVGENGHEENTESSLASSCSELEHTYL